jgi:hypothetical protein
MYDINGNRLENTVNLTGYMADGITQSPGSKAAQKLLKVFVKHFYQNIIRSTEFSIRGDEYFEDQ